jgi:hypothetical protein
MMLGQAVKVQREMKGLYALGAIGRVQREMLGLIVTLQREMYAGCREIGERARELGSK